MEGLTPMHKSQPLLLLPPLAVNPRLSPRPYRSDVSLPTPPTAPHKYYTTLLVSMFTTAAAANVLCCRYNRAAIFGIGEPLADRAAWRQLTELFLAEFPEAYFYHVTEEYAYLLHDMGYYINCCGTETTLQVGEASQRCSRKPSMSCQRLLGT